MVFHSLRLLADLPACQPAPSLLPTCFFCKSHDFFCEPFNVSFLANDIQPQWTSPGSCHPVEKERNFERHSQR